MEERAVRVEQPILDDERDLVGARGDADRIGLSARVEFVPENVCGRETGEGVQTGGPEAVVVEPQERGRHLRLLIGVEDSAESGSAPVGSRGRRTVQPPSPRRGDRTSIWVPGSTRAAGTSAASARRT
jgi:hypothetical protein